MREQRAPDASATRDVAAAPQRLWETITDLDSISTRSPETFAARWTRGSGPAAGGRFRGWNRNGPLVWATTCTVTQSEPGRTFAFAVSAMGLPVATWRWDIEPTGSGSTVTLSTWDRRGRLMKVVGTGTGVRDRARHNQAGIETTLERLAAEMVLD